LKHVEKASHLPRPQVEAIENDLHLPYANQEVSYINPKGNITLSGTFSKPNQGRKFPAVLLITGSGAQDRDETLFEHKPFLVLADYLARRGIAVLRVDDRGIGKSGGDLKGTTLDFADDVRAGIAYLKTRRDVNPRKIGLIGHSEGGLIAPIVASSSRDVAFIVLMAGTGVTGDQVILSQVIKPMEIQKMRPAVIEKAREQQSAVLQIAMNEANPDSAVVKMLKALYPNPERLPVSARQQIEAQLRPMLSPWYHTFLSLDPAPYLQKVKCPVLALNGDKDVQVIADLNLPKIESALKSGNNRRYLIKTLPNLNHLFQTATTGLTSEYGQITETLAPIALETIATWILEQVR
jgi:pimeloyl-ACP methyl ester carboxylesterase